MLHKFKLLKEMKRQLGLRTTIESILFHVGLRKQCIINYPGTSLAIKVNKGPLIFWKSLEKGVWESDLINFIIGLVTPRETILDVGAWIGPLTFLFSHLVGKNGRVYAFEPMPESFSLLEHYVASNNVGNVLLYNMAVFNVSNYVTLYSPSATSVMATVLKPKNLERQKRVSEYKVQQKCKCVTIDGFCSSQNIRPTGIKVDVEGSERYVLDGTINTIEKYHPWCLLEFHGDSISESERQRIWSFVTDRAKKIVYIQGNEVELTYGMELPFDFQPTERANYCIFF